VSNRSFIESQAFDGFRKVAANEFSEIWLVDLGGNVRENPKLSGTKHNVFGIQTGVTISFMVKRARHKGCRVFYARRPELETAEEKLSWLDGAKLSSVDTEEITPDEAGTWLNPGERDFAALLPLVDKIAKAAKSKRGERAIFKLFSPGLKSQRDEWVYDFSPKALEAKMRFFISSYEATRAQRVRESSSTIKWDSELDRYLKANIRKTYDENAIVGALYRPYCSRLLYFDRHFIGRQYQMPSMFRDGRAKNSVIVFSDRGSRSPFSILATSEIPELHLCASTDGFQVVPFLVYGDGASQSGDNITDWALDQFKKHYQPGRAKQNRPITKEAIFHYVYAVLHDQVYREKYAQNLKREFPRIPFYADFWQWTDWGKELMDLHTGYERVEGFKLKRVDRRDEKSRKAGVAPKAMLKAEKEAGSIVLDSETTLSGIPREAWTYTLGNRSALEWILDQYKEKKPKDPTIREKYDTYRFADFKEKVINLLLRVTSVSVRTVAIVNAMKQAHR
jgi:predicted helicase